MGNLLFDCRLRPEGQQSGLFRLYLSSDGVHKIEFVPTQVLNGYTVLAGHEESRKILAEMRDLCSSLGTSLSIDEDLEGRILNISTWWRVTGRVERNIMPAFLLNVEGQTPRRGTPWYTRHDPGDWTLPLSMLKPGQIVEDRYPARLAGLPAGRCKVYALVIDTTGIEDNRILGKQQFPGEITVLPKENR